MKYRLKDRELQAKLDELSGGDFSKNLHLFDDELFASGWGKNFFFNQTEDENGEELEEPRTYKQSQFAAFFNANEVEAVPEYNPHSWNEWPAVEPPAMTAMRIEADDGTGIKAFWDEGWRRYGSGVFISCPSLKFRPWEDE